MPSIRIVDLHCHCLPGVDDGPATLVDSLALCRALADAGVTDVVATPHALGRYDGRNHPSLIRAAVDDLRDALAAAAIDLAVWPGADARIDERMADLVARDALLTVADRGAYLLVELPAASLVPPRRLLADLAGIGVTAILTHPERQPLVRQNDAALDDWLDGGALLQITTGSLIGQFGEAARDAAFDWIERGLVHLVASDAHGMDRRPPAWGEAIEALLDVTDEAGVRQLCETNPRAVLEAGATKFPRGAGAAGR